MDSFHFVLSPFFYSFILSQEHQMNTAIGLLETKGLVGLIEATDAMAKAANVKILKRVSIGNAYVATVVQGDVGSVRAAVEAGANAAQQAGELIASHVIPRPADTLVASFFS
jgi:ethanolamine utilization protein EutM